MSAVVFDPQTGHALSVDHQRIAEIIHDYDPSLELAWIPPSERNANDDFPFAVLHRTPGGVVDYIVFKLRESEVNHTVLTRLWENDTTKNDVLGIIERDEAARNLVEMKKQMDEAEEARELATWALKARPGAKHNGVRFE
jgi:hypothetical protein